jgi:SAM-dependent methyltransferase
MTKAPSQKEFFENWTSYNDDLHKAQGLVYRQAEALINARISGKRLVDVGNGGVFNYDVAKAETIAAVDLYPVPQLDAQKNATYHVGRSDRLPLTEASSDLVIWQNLMHHMIEDRAGDPVPMLRASLSEAHRVLRSGGEIMIIETFCSHFLFRAQGLLFPLTRIVLSLIKHPFVRLLSRKKVIELLIENGFEICEQTEIKKDRFMILLGVPVPTRWLPLRIFCLRAQRVNSAG